MWLLNGQMTHVTSTKRQKTFAKHVDFFYLEKK